MEGATTCDSWPWGGGTLLAIGGVAKSYKFQEFQLVMFNEINNDKEPVEYPGLESFRRLQSSTGLKLAGPAALP